MALIDIDWSLDDLSVKSISKKSFDCHSPVCLKVAAFSKQPILDFHNVKIGTSKVLSLNLLNPSDDDTVVSVVPLSTDCDFQLESIVEENEPILLQPNTTFVLDVKFSPSQSGNVRQVINFKWDGGPRLQAVLIGCGVADPKKKAKTKRKIPSAVVSAKTQLKSNLLSPPKRTALAPIQPDTPVRRTTFLVTKTTNDYGALDKENTNNIQKPSCSPISFEKQNNTRSADDRKPFMPTNKTNRNLLDAPVITDNIERKTYNVQKKDIAKKDDAKRTLFDSKSKKTKLATQEEKPKQTNFLRRKSQSQKLPPKRSMAAGVAIKKLSLKAPKTSMARHPMPFAAKNMYYDERWIDKQERGFTNWLNFILTPEIEETQSMSDQTVDRRETYTIDASKRQPIAPTKEDLSFRAYSLRRRMARLRRSACMMYQSETFMNSIHQIEKEVECGLLAVRAEKRIEADLGIKNKILKMFLSYNSLWLRIGLEVIYGEIIPLHSNNDVSNLTRFIHQRLFANPDIARQYSHPTVPNLFKPGYEAALSKFMMKKFLLLVVFLDYAKENRLIDHDPCLFNKDAEFKASRDLLIAFSRDYLKGEGDITKHLGYLGVTVKHSQTALDEYDYGIKNIAVDLRDGVRLVRVVELLTKQWMLSSKVRLPAVSRLQKVHNVGLALSYLSQQGLTINQDPKCVVDGHREKTLIILWQIIFHFQVKGTSQDVDVKNQVGILLDIDKLKDEVTYLKKRIHLHTQMLLPMKSSATAGAGGNDEFLGIDRRDSLDKEIYFRSDKLSLLLTWCKIICAHYEVKEKGAIFQYSTYKIQIENFTVSFSDGIAFCCIVNFYHPDLLPKSLINHETTLTCNIAQQEDGVEDDFFYDNWTKCFSPTTGVNRRLETLLNNEKENYRTLNEAIQELGGIPSMLRPSDLSNTIPDEKVVITYISYLCARLLNIREETQAARKIQLAWRKYRFNKKRELFLVEDAAASKIQACFRGFIGRMDFIVYRECVIVCQSIARRWLVLYNIQRREEAAYKIQEAYKSFVEFSRVRYEFLQMRTSAVIIQRAYRCHLQDSYAVQELAATKIQAMWRGYVQYNLFFGMKVCAIFIQSVIRMFLQRQRFLKRKDAVILIQSQYRSYLETKKQRSEFLTSKNSVVIIQEFWRGAKQARKERFRYLKLRSATVKLQSFSRMVLAKKQYQQKKDAAIKIEKWYQCCLEAQTDRAQYLKCKSAVLTIQSHIRSWLVSRQIRCMLNAATTIQSFWIGRQLMFQNRESYHLKRRAVITIQSVWRMHQARQNYKLKVCSATIIQQFFRNVLVVRKERLRNRTLQNAATCIQTVARMFLCRKKFKKQRCAVLTLQQFWKGYLLMKKDVDNFNKTKSQIIRCQSYIRMFLDRCKYLQKILAVTKIQAFTKMIIARNRYHKEQKSAVLIQASLRRMICHQRFNTMRNAVITIQSFVRMVQARRRFIVMKNAATTIQSRYRCFKTLKLFTTKKDACIKIQSLCRMFIAKQRYDHLLKCCIIIQSHYKGMLERRRYRKKHNAVVVIQSSFRMTREKEKFRKVRKATVIIQSSARRFIARKNFVDKKQAAVQLQAYFRMYTTRRGFLKKSHSALMIQSVYRGYKQRKSYLNYLAMIIKLQSYIRMVARRKRYLKERDSAKTIQSFVRMIQAQKIFLKQKNACKKLQSFYRMYSTKQKYALQQSSVVKLQSCWRMYVARQKYQQVRSAVIVLQTFARTQKLVKQFNMLKTNIIKVQSVVRMQAARRQFLQMRKAITKIQSVMRMYFERSKYVRMKQAAVVIQTSFRRYSAVQSFHVKKHAIVTIQSYWRMHLATRKLTRIKTAVVSIQAYYRMCHQREEYNKMKTAVQRIQRSWRRYCNEKKMMKREVNAVMIQSTVRIYLTRREYERKKCAVIRLQALYRMYNERISYVQLQKASCTLQRYYRGFRVRQLLFKRNKAAVKIQSFWRMYFAKKAYSKKLNSAICIQSFYRMFSNKTNFQKKRSAVICIQSTYRSFVLCHRYQQMRVNALRIQTWYRSLRCRMKYMQHLHVLHTTKIRQRNAAITIQRRFRAFSVGYTCYLNYHITRGAIMTIQTNYRMFAQRKKYQNMKTSIVLLQSTVRMYLAKKMYNAKRNAVILIQATWRMHCERVAFHQKKQAAVKISSMMKMCLKRNSYQKQKVAVTKIQCFVRMVQAKRAYQSTLSSCIVLQRWWKKLLYLNEKKRQKEASILIQSVYRGYVARNDFQHKIKNIVKLQAIVRQYLARKRFLQQKHATHVIQQWYRNTSERRMFEKQTHAAIVIQRNYRAFVVGQLCYIRFHVMRGAAITIQALIRGFLARRNLQTKHQKAIVIQAMVRSYLQKSRYLVLKHSTIIMQKNAKRTIAVTNYRITRKRIILLQRCIRRWLVQQQLHRLRHQHCAAIKIQCAVRRMQAKSVSKQLRLKQENERRYEMEVMSATVIQSVWRMNVQKRHYKLTLEAIHKIQAFTRGFNQRSCYLKTRENIVFLQRWFRSCYARDVQRHHYLRLQQSSIIIQKYWRCYHAQKEYLKTLATVMFLQRHWRDLQLTSVARREFLVKKSAVHLIQKVFRRYLVLKQENQNRAAAIVVSFFKMIQAKKDFIRICQATKCIQRFWREYQERKLNRKRNEAARLLQNWYTRLQQTKTFREEYLQKKKSVVVIQNAYRRYQLRQNLRVNLKSLLLKQSASCKIQDVYRNYLIMKRTRMQYLRKKEAVVCLQKHFRILLRRNRAVRMDKAACKIQSWYLQRRNERNERKLLLQRQHLIDVFASATKMCLAVLKIQRRRRAVLKWRQEWYIRRQDEAALSIQATWRGFVVRKMIKDKRVKEARRRIEVANNNVTEPMKLCNRTKCALDYLLHVKNLSTVHDALKQLDVVTVLSFKCCEKLVIDNALPVIFKIIKHGNRSLPWISIKQVAFSILLNVAKCPTTYRAVYDEQQSLEIILEQMTNYREKKSFIFPMGCNLLSVFCNDEQLKKELKNKPVVIEKISAFYRMSQRKHKLDQHRNSTKEKEQHFTKTAWHRRASCIDSRDPYTAILLLSKKLSIKTTVR